MNGGPAGDLYVVFRVKPSETFKRDGDDIYYKLNVSFPQAALGDEIKIPTLNNEVMLTIPAGTQTGKQFRLKRKGYKKCSWLWMQQSDVDILRECLKSLN